MKFADLMKIVADANAAGLPADAPVLFDGAAILGRAEIDLGSKLDPQEEVVRVACLKLFHAV